jgi:hypothetical protein
MQKAGFALALGLGMLVGAPAFASEDCKEYPREQWLMPEQIKAKAEELGYSVRSIGEDDGCWEIKGTDKTGRKVEAYFDPVTAQLVKTKGD